MGFRDFNRSDRFSAQIRRLLSTAIHRDLPDEHTTFITVSDVEVTRDLSLATVYINTLFPDQSEAGLTILNQNAKALRQILSKQLRARKIPELRFKYDASLERGQQLESLIKKARASDPGLSEPGEDENE